MPLERGAVGLDGPILLEAVRQAGPVERERVRDLGERRTRAGDRPVHADRAPVGQRPEVRELGVAVEQGPGRLGQGVEQRPGRPAERPQRRGQLGGGVVEPLPALGGDARHRLREPERRLGVERVGAEERVAVADRHEADVVVPAPARRVQRGEVVEEPEVLLLVDRRVAGGNQPATDVAHQHRAVPLLAGGADGGMVDAVGQQVEHAGLPDPYRDATDVAGLAHDPVVAVIDVLEHERLVVDHHALEAGARPRVLDRHRHPARRARDQVVDRRRHRSWTHHVPPPVPAQNWPRSTTTCWGADPHPASVPPLATTVHAPAPPWRITVSGVKVAPGFAASCTAAHVGSDGARRHDATSASASRVGDPRVDRGADRSGVGPARSGRRVGGGRRGGRGVGGRARNRNRRGRGAGRARGRRGRRRRRPGRRRGGRGRGGVVVADRVRREDRGDDERDGDDPGEHPASGHRASLAGRAADGATFPASLPIPRPTSRPTSRSRTRSPTPPTSSRCAGSERAT